MSLREDFYDIAYEMAQLVNKDVKKIEEKAKITIQYYQKEMEKVIRRDLNKLEHTLMYEELYNLNINESERIAQINQAIAEKKAECIEKFIHLLKAKLKDLIHEYPEEYFSFLFNKIKEFVPLFNKRVYIKFNQHDLNYIKQEPRFNKYPSLKFDHQISKNPIETAAGFKIIPEDESFEIDFTLESQLNKYGNLLSMKFMEIFPVFEVNVKDALAIEREKHGGM